MALADTSRILALSGLPADGLLSFFCLKDSETDEVFGPAKVILTPAATSLSILEAPEDLEAGNRLGELAVTPELQLTLPDLGSDDFGALGVEDETAYSDLLTALGDAYPRHRLGGHPAVLQADVLESARWCPTPIPSDELRGHPWTLLLQVAHDYDRLGVGFGDSGVLYFCLPEAHLAAGRLDCVVAVAQGY